MELLTVGIRNLLNAFHYAARKVALGSRIQKLDETGDLVGNVTGNVTGNTAGTHTGAVVGNVTGNLTGNVAGSVAVGAGGAVAFGTSALTRNGNNIVATLPTQDPQVAGALYVSAGAGRVDLRPRGGYSGASPGGLPGDTEATMRCVLVAVLGLLATAPGVSAATYYVDQAHPSASDTSAGTSPAMPWRTITKAANTVAAGDTVIVKAGTYAEQVTLLAPHGGQAGNLITFRANPGDQVVVTGGGMRTFGFRVGVSYVRVEGFEVTGVTGHGILVGWSDGASVGCEIVNNNIHDGGGNPDTAAVYYAGGNHGLIQGNHLYNNAGDGITFSSADMTIRNNVIEHNQVDGIKGGGGGTILIEGNTIHDMTIAVHHGDGMQLMGMTGTLIVRNNTVWDCTQDIYCDDYSGTAGAQPWGDVYIYNNVVYNTVPGPTGIEGYYNGIVTGTRYNSWNSITVCGNTVVNCNNGSGGLSVGVVGTIPYKIGTVKVFNNLFYNSTNNVAVTALRAQGGQVQMDYDVYFNQWRSWYFGENWVNLAQFRTAHPECEVHGFYSTGITFVNYALVNPDLHLAAGSAAIDKGCAVAAVGNVRFDSDRDGLARPQGTAWDIGAYVTVGSLVGDVNGSGKVTMADLLDVRSHVGQPATGLNAKYDLDLNGEITGADMLIVRQNLGNTLP